MYTQHFGGIRFSTAELSMDQSNWKKAYEFVKWWNRERVLILLSDAYSEISDTDWNFATKNTNHNESLNRRSVVDKKATKLHGQLSHMYREDPKRAFQHITNAEKRIGDSKTSYVGRK